ncbi:MAG: dockerin type I repeat-containing protein [Phycisphaerae bacterium]
MLPVTLALAFCAPRVGATVPDIVFTLHASNGAGAGSFYVPSNKGDWDPNSETFTWALPAPIDIYDDLTREWIATLLNAEVVLCTRQLCKIDIDIGVVSGRSETTFTVASALVSFPTIPADFAEARAMAAFTVTDVDGDNACLTGLGPPGTGAFRSYYNGYLSEGTRFTHLIGRIFVSNGGTASASQNDPMFGFRPIGEDVEDLSSEIAFTLTPNDYAAALTTMSMPEPDTCVGDINDDGVIDAADVSELLAAYGAEMGDSNYNAAADLDDNGRVDLVDVSQLLAVYGQTCP